MNIDKNASLGFIVTVIQCTSIAQYRMLFYNNKTWTWKSETDDEFTTKKFKEFLTIFNHSFKEYNIKTKFLPWRTND